MRILTIFTLEVGRNTWYIDKHEDTCRPTYQVCCDEKFKKSFLSFAEALEYVFTSVHRMDFVAK